MCLEICHSERSEESHTAQGEFDSRVGNDLRVVPRSFSRFYGRAMHAPTGLCEFVILSDSEESPTARKRILCTRRARACSRRFFVLCKIGGLLGRFVNRLRFAKRRKYTQIQKTARAVEDARPYSGSCIAADEHKQKQLSAIFQKAVFILCFERVRDTSTANSLTFRGTCGGRSHSSVR